MIHTMLRNSPSNTFVMVLMICVGWAVSPLTLSGQHTAIVGATIIDGNGGAPTEDAVLLVQGETIEAIGPRGSISIPAGAEIIDAVGMFVVPGFVDTNVHISLYGGGADRTSDRKETSLVYRDRDAELTLEAAQMHLKFGVTTVRDSYGALVPLRETRDAIESGQAIGPRMLIAGNIVGWGGPYSLTFALIKETDGLSVYEQQFNDYIAQGVGEELVDMYPSELKTAINTYLDKQVDFIKYGGTSHFSPGLIGFSPEAQRVIVEETHKRGLIAETHATTPEGLRLAIEAGIDLIQHPEVLGGREYTDELIRSIVDRDIICSMLVNTVTGEAWQRHLRNRADAERTLAERSEERSRSSLKRPVTREKTSAEYRSELRSLGHGTEMRRRNTEKLINGGCIVTLGTDNYAGAAPEFQNGPKPLWQEPGIGTLIAIEGLVELGMTPNEAIVAATRNGALASKALDRFGTLEAGKIADLLVLGADPLEDISNIRQINIIMKEGLLIDRDQLPTTPIMYLRDSTLSPR